CTVRDLHELGDLDDTSGQRDLLTAALAWITLPVPPLVRSAERVERLSGKAELLSERAGEASMLGDHRLDLFVPAEQELEAHPEAVQGRRACTDEPEK